MEQSESGCGAVPLNLTIHRGCSDDDHDSIEWPGQFRAAAWVLHCARESWMSDVGGPSEAINRRMLITQVDWETVTD